MSSFKASAKNPRPLGVLSRTLGALGLSLAVSTLSIHAHAACVYTVSQWSNGFTGTIKITNDTAAAVSNWSVSWQYAGDNRITSAYDTTLTGTNPYTAKNAGWNGTLQPNASITFGFQGTKGAAAAEMPVITGALCGNTVTSSSTAVSSSLAPSSSSRSSSSVASSSIVPSSSSRSNSSVASSSSTPSSVASSSVAAAGWTLNTTDSYLNFATTKNTHNLEVHNFTSIGGDINAAGVATLTIDLNTVNTGVALRDQRMRDLLFETAANPTATVTVKLLRSTPLSLWTLRSSMTPVNWMKQREKLS